MRLTHAWNSLRGKLENLTRPTKLHRSCCHPECSERLGFHELTLRSFVHFHGRPRIVFRVTQRLDRAIYTLRLSSNAQTPSMMNDLVRVQNPPVARDDLHQILFDLLRVVVLGEFPPPRNAVHVRIDHHADGLLEPRAEHDVCGLASNAG